MTDQSIFDQSGYRPVAVGKRLREYRKKNGLSIKELAEKSDLALNTLSLIENDKSSPSVSTLEHLAKALNIPLAVFFEPVREKLDLVYTKSTSRRSMSLDGILVEDCGLKLDDHSIQPLVVTLAPGKGCGQAVIRHSGYEFVYCLSGHLNYDIDGRGISLKAGDSLAFNAERPHQWCNPTEVPATYLLILLPGNIDDLPGEMHFPVKAPENNERITSV